MIIKSTVRGNGGQLANYLLNDKKNDRAELVEMRGTAATLRNALVMSEAIAHGKTHCEKPFYHVSFRLPSGEALKPEQWEQCADTLEQRLGLENHHRALVMHTYQGEKHLHVVWDRIDENTLKAVNLFQDRPKCKEVARELERELGLQRVRNEKREPEKELAAPTMTEEQQARRKGQDLKEIRATIREAWEQSADGRSFAEALDERGLMLAQGDKRDYVALAEQGSVYSIGKRTTGATAREVREKLADLERERIPTVAQARVDFPQRQQEREGRQRAAQERPQEAIELQGQAPMQGGARKRGANAPRGPRDVGYSGGADDRAGTDARTGTRAQRVARGGSGKRTGKQCERVCRKGAGLHRNSSGRIDRRHGQPVRRRQRRAPAADGAGTAPRPEDRFAEATRAGSERAGFTEYQQERAARRRPQRRRSAGVAPRAA